MTDNHLDVAEMAALEMVTSTINRDSQGLDAALLLMQGMTNDEFARIVVTLTKLGAVLARTTASHLDSDAATVARVTVESISELRREEEL